MLMSKFRPIVRYVVGAGVLTSSFFIYSGYVDSIKPSKFHLSMNKLGFEERTLKEADVFRRISIEEQEEAFLKILYMAGYFKPEKLWKDINKIESFKDPERAFNIILSSMVKSGATQDDISKFNPKILRKNLCKTEEIEESQLVDLLVYISQHAFSRAHGQERNELKSVYWMSEYNDQYMECARSLGLIGRIGSTHAEYDEAWIAGASRVGLIARVIDFLQLKEKGVKILGDTKILAGGRPIWAEIDGISPDLKSSLLKVHSSGSSIDSLDVTLQVGDTVERTKEGVEYISYLAKFYNVALDNSSPVIQYTKDSAPKGLFPGRHYPNYAKGETKQLTETLMSQEVLWFLSAGKLFSIVDTDFSGTRPTTATTSRDVVKAFVEKVEKASSQDQKEFHIILQSNNPYIERQALAAQFEVNKFLKEKGLDSLGWKIIVEGIGFANKQDVPIVHSELGALMGIKWMMLDGGTGEKIMFQTRDKSDFTEPMPDLTYLESGPLNFLGISQFAQDFWDEVLE